MEPLYDRLADLKAGEYTLGGGVVDPLPEAILKYSNEIRSAVMIVHGRDPV